MTPPKGDTVHEYPFNRSARPERDVYLLEDFGPHLGRGWRETDAERADRESLIRDLVAGEYRPVRIVAFNSRPLRSPFEWRRESECSS